MSETSIVCPNMRKKVRKYGVKQKFEPKCICLLWTNYKDTDLASLIVKYHLISQKTIYFTGACRTQNVWLINNLTPGWCEKDAFQGL